MNIDNPKKISKQKTLLIIFQIIGIILVFATIHSFYNIYKKNKNYELNGYQTASTTCTQESSYIKTITRQKKHQTYSIL